MTTDQDRYLVEDPHPDELHGLRQWVAHQLDAWGVDGEHRDDVVLVVSELATNAVRHARTAFAVSVHRDEDRTRVEVFDRDTRLPVMVGSDPDATSGRGLQIVAALCTEWGSRTEEQEDVRGKVVWAEVAPPED